jgi:SAM-dependent methyltransferase
MAEPRQPLIRPLVGRAKAEPASTLPDGTLPGPIYSFIVDRDPVFAYEGYHLARSLVRHCGADPAAIHVQFTPEASAARSVFSDLGCTLHEIMRFGDGRCCNKIAQLANLEGHDFTHAVLLDTDTITVSDLRRHLRKSALVAKTVDAPNPSVEALQEIARRAGMRALPALVTVDAGSGQTYLGNCNGGFYAIPKGLYRTVDTEWRRWAGWLLDNLEPLKREGKEAHVDQVAMWLAIHMAGIPYEAAPSNANYYVHFTGPHHGFDPDFDISLIHYHDMSLNVLGRIEPKAELSAVEQRAVADANRQIGEGFENVTFWNLRYARFLERGSGVGSRGANLSYKRQLLVQEGAERATSVLDVGCGDLEVVKALDLSSYIGIDTSEAALEIARQARPGWDFRFAASGKMPADIPARQFVLCFEVLIHQPSAIRYRTLVQFLASHTAGTLLVSGYESGTEQTSSNPMLFFYEPLEESLRQTGRFTAIRKVGAHSDVAIYRCDV